jgi:transposase
MVKQGANPGRTAAEFDVLETKVASLENENANLRRKLERMNELLLEAQRARFGQSSEKRVYVMEGGTEQLQIFNEAEKEQDVKAEEPTPETFTVKEHKRAKKRTQEEILADLPVEEAVYELGGDQLICAKCSGTLRMIGKDLVRKEIITIPAQTKLLYYYSCSYACDCCEKETGNASIYKAQTPPPLMKHSMASPASVADIMTKKYVDGLPLYRQEQIWKRSGVQLSRNTLANWVIQCSQGWLKPIYKRLKKHLLEEPLIGADETIVQVLKEPDRPATSDSRMWVYTTGSQAKRQIRIFEYQPTRGAEHPKRFLSGFKGLLQTDGYVSYDKVEDVTRCGCWAHTRRKWREAMPKGATKETSKAAIGFDYCNKLFAMEKELNKKQGGRDDRARLMKPIMEAYWDWLDTVNPESGSKLETAANYSKNQKVYLCTFLSHKEADISNNLAENCIRPFVIGRKNWLFCDTVKGADSSAIVYSMVETAKANGVDPYAYLLRVLTYMPYLGKTPPNEELDKLMPWQLPNI